MKNAGKFDNQHAKIIVIYQFMFNYFLNTYDQ